MQTSKNDLLLMVCVKEINRKQKGTSGTEQQKCSDRVMKCEFLFDWQKILPQDLSSE